MTLSSQRSAQGAGGRERGSDAPFAVAGVSKRYGPVVAVDDVDLGLAGGEVHALVGQNGSGKSTIAKMLAGFVRPDAGSVVVDGSPVRFGRPERARAAGISTVFQELSVLPSLSVAENVFVDRSPRLPLGPIRRRELNRRTAAVLERYRIDLVPHARCADLSLQELQLVEIARALAFNCRVVIFDEPTSSLTFSETQSLFQTIRRLKASNVGIIYISHKLSEVFSLSDRVTVMRDGHTRGTLNTSETDEDEVTRLMIGRSLESYFVRANVAAGEELLRVEGLTVPGYLKGIDFSVRRGEVLGFYGLIGAGRSEAMEAVFGVRQKSAGRIFWQGREVRIRSARDAVALGIGLAPEDRKRQGLILGMSCQDNLTMVLMRRAGLLRAHDASGERRVYEKFRKILDIKAASPRSIVGTLSGGNQQKIVLAKWLSTEPRLLVLDEPTRGIDVGAKAEIHKLISELAESGVSIVLISSELPEILGLATRIITFNEGRITGSLDGRSATEESVMNSLLSGRLHS